MLNDLGFAGRYLWRRRAVAGLAVAMMSIGIGATTAMFSVVNSVLWRALPYEASGRLVTIWQTFPHWRGQPALDNQWDRIPLSYTEYRDVATLDQWFESVAAAYWRQGVALRATGETVEVTVARGSASLLPLLGVRPAIGRWFLPADEGPTGAPLAVLSHSIWMRRFGAEPSIVGRPILLNDRPFVVIGVLPSGFGLQSLSPFAISTDPDVVWTPIGSWPGDLVQNSQNYEILARVREGAALEPVRQDVARLIRGNRNAAQHDARVVPRLDAETLRVRTPFFSLLVAAAMLLAIACANLAALLLAEAAGRETEVQVRRALGASRSRIVRQLVIETGVLAAAGAALGLPLAFALTRGLLALAPFDVPRAGEIGVDWRVLVLTCALAAGAAIACGLVPAFSLVRSHAIAPGASRTTTARGGRTQHVLIAAQAGLSLVLLVSTGLLVRTLALERAVPLGFDRDRLLTVGLSRAPQDFFDRALDRIGALPGVTAVTATSNPPIEGKGGLWAVRTEPGGRLSLTSPSAQHDEVLPNFFDVLRVPILAGRGLDDVDVPGAPLVAIVNETMARRFWPRGSPIGQTFVAPNGGSRTVVGIVADVHEAPPGLPVAATFYENIRQVPSSSPTLLIKTSADPRVLASAIRQAIVSLDPTRPVPAIATMDDIVDRSLAPERFRVLLAVFFAVAAIGMTLIGVFAVALRGVTARMRESCIRLALGASSATIVSQLVAAYVRVGAAGVLAGLAVAGFGTRLLRTYLFGVTAGDPLTFAASALLLLMLLALAAWLPARAVREARIPAHLGGR